MSSFPTNEPSFTFLISFNFKRIIFAIIDFSSTSVKKKTVLRSFELVRNELTIRHNFAIYLNTIDSTTSTTRSARYVSAAATGNDFICDTGTAETWKATSIPRASGMWYVYKCVCSTRSRTGSSFNPPDARTIEVYTYRHYNGVITANRSYTEERLSGEITKYTVIMNVSLRYTYINFSRHRHSLFYYSFFINWQRVWTWYS